MNWQNVWRERPYLPLLLILLLAFSLRLYMLDSQSLWWDELKTIDRATLPWSDWFIDFSNKKNQVPFYYLLMRGWVWLGTSAFVVRFFSLLLGLLSVAAIYQLGRVVVSARVGLTAAFLLAISPFHIWYSQEARMYSLLATQLILAHVGLIALLQGKNKRYWLLYFVAMGTAVFTHYFTFLIILAHAIYFILHLRLHPTLSRQWFGLMTILALAFVPWIFLLGGSSGYSAAVPTWIDPIHWREPFLTFWNFSTGPTIDPMSPLGFLGLAIFAGGFLRMLFHRSAPTGQQKLTNRLLLLWLFVPLLLIYIVSLSGAFSLYVDRYLTIILPVFLLFVAWGWVRLTQNRPIWLWGFCGLAAAVAAAGVFNMATNTSHARNDWAAAFSTLSEHWQPQDHVIGTRDVLLPLHSYGRSTMTYLEIPPPESATVTPAFAQAMAAQFASATATNAGRFWFIEPFYVTDPHGWAAQRNTLVNGPLTNPHHQWLSAQFDLIETWRFPGVRLTLYEANESP
ncbi:MAG: hypothetical protein CL608_09065 [Anaerolineaceae bacterium]|nr:hypothetical protein [Anaerolineaceae bacterium]